MENQASRCSDATLERLAKNGILFQQQLFAFEIANASRQEVGDFGVQLVQASIHALILFNCRNFHFYTCWGDKSIPSLSPQEVIEHVSVIVSASEDVIEKLRIPAVSLIFPLRMAGACARSDEQRSKIFHLLTGLVSMGFVAADRIRVDLQELWIFEAMIAA